MRQFLLSCLFVLFASPAVADRIPVDIFISEERSRVLLEIPALADWDASLSQNRIRVAVPGAEGFDLNDLDQLNESSLISGLSEGLRPEELHIGLNCDCMIDSYVIKDGLLTIDITNRAEQSHSLDFPTLASGTIKPWHQPAATPLQTPKSTRLTVGPLIPPETLDVGIPKGLANAAYQGLIEFNKEGLREDRSNVPSRILSNVAIGVDSQLSTPQTDSHQASNTALFACEDVQNTLLDIWSNKTSFNLQIAIARTEAFVDGQSSDLSNSNRLAAIYVGHGLGIEASLILNRDNDASDLALGLLYIASITDDLPNITPNNIETCDNELILWRFLADPNSLDGALDPTSLLRSYKLLPQQLQARLAERFAKALIQTGLERYKDELHDYRFTSVESDHETFGLPPKKSTNQTNDTRRNILRANLSETDFDPLTATLNDPRVLPLDLLETLQFERRDTTGDIELIDEILTQYVQSRNFTAMLNLLTDSAERLNSEVLQALTDKHLLGAVDLMGNHELVALAFRDNLPLLSKRLKEDLSTRLRSLGVRPPEHLRTEDTVTPVVTAQYEDPPTTFSLPKTKEIARNISPTYEESEAILNTSIEIRKAIETHLYD